ncbi:AAA family ATPase [Brevibacterium sp. GP-SGM9]|uniref:AAA family ATPase n=1 Tax=unclassified Brevibacterium TaxID=2614124 RepID=UPI001E429E38|nr:MULTISPECIES: AAA family ATPase [unclassified Brevibacterium]MDK8436381.1 AAA family ATPase [Brevibacterium sp. H-BE7]
MSRRQSISAARRCQEPQVESAERANAPATPLIVVAGVPGAGKTEALKALRIQSPGLRMADPDRVRCRLRRLVPWLPYAYGRPIVHVIAHLWVFARILNRGRGSLVVHDPGTRRWSRRMIVELARLCGYRPMIIYIETNRDTALKGQTQRKRVVRSYSFKRHWEHWLELQNHILETGEVGADEPWCRVVLSRREAVVDDVLGLLSPRRIESS